MNIVVEHDKEHHKFISDLEGKVSHLQYKVLPDGKTLGYVSTFVPVELRGRKIAQQIVKVALDYAKENNYKVIPLCSFVQDYVDHHPEYNDIIVIPF